MSEVTRLEGSVILPREDFIELQTAAWDRTPTAGERVGTTIQTTFVFAGVAGAVAAGSWGWAKAVNWLEERRHKRTMNIAQFEVDNQRTVTEK